MYLRAGTTLYRDVAYILYLKIILICIKMKVSHVLCAVPLTWKTLSAIPTGMEFPGLSCFRNIIQSWYTYIHLIRHCTFFAQFDICQSRLSFGEVYISFEIVIGHEFFARYYFIGHKRPLDIYISRLCAAYTIYDISAEISSTRIVSKYAVIGN